MTPPDLAGIIERDQAWTLDDLTCYAAQDDRRALLGLLRETREALHDVGYCHGCIKNMENDGPEKLLGRLDVAFGAEP